MISLILYSIESSIHLLIEAIKKPSGGKKAKKAREKSNRESLMTNPVLLLNKFEADKTNFF